MKCKCGGATIILDSRHTTEGGRWRRRKCLTCNQKFTTLEYIIDEVQDKRGRPIQVEQSTAKPLFTKARHRIEDLKAENENS